MDILHIIGFVLLLLLYIGTFIIASDFAYKRIENKRKGYLRVDHSDPEQPYIFLELDEKDADELKDGEFITIQIKVKNYIE